jgi:hypothetical protein
MSRGSRALLNPVYLMIDRYLDRRERFFIIHFQKMNDFINQKRYHAACLILCHVHVVIAAPCCCWLGRLSHTHLHREERRQSSYSDCVRPNQRSVSWLTVISADRYAYSCLATSTFYT